MAKCNVMQDTFFDRIAVCGVIGGIHPLTCDLKTAELFGYHVRGTS